MSKILVTGGTGFIGSRVAEEFVGKNEVTCAALDDNKISFVETVKGDLSNKSFVDKLGNFDILIHLAAEVNVKSLIDRPVEGFLNNTLSTLYLLDKIKNSGAFFVYASTDRVYGTPAKKTVNEESGMSPIDPYAASKAASEHLITSFGRTYGIEYSILRFANIYGPGQRSSLFIPSVINQMKTSEQIETGYLKMYRNFVYIDDALAAFSKVIAKRKTGIFNVSSDNAQMSDVLKILLGLGERHFKRKFKVIHNPVLVRPQSSETKRFFLDCRKIKKIGWKPRYGLKTGLLETFRREIS
jgi:nucleoside-diphosphate-sugar epimerase